MKTKGLIFGHSTHHIIELKVWIKENSDLESYYKQLANEFRTKLKLYKNLPLNNVLKLRNYNLI